MFQLPPQIVLGCSNSKWYLNLVWVPLNTSCKNQEPTRHEHNVTAFFIQNYIGFITDVLTIDFFHHRAQSQLIQVVLLVSVIMHL